MKYYPAHLEGSVESATNRFAHEADDYHHYFQIVCSCGGRRFRTSLSNKKSVRVECIICGRRATVYDLGHYPAATKIPGTEEFHDSDKTGQVYVMYEYGERDPDQDFDRNDITWCQVWIENDEGKLKLLLDDETA